MKKWNCLVIMVCLVLVFQFCSFAQQYSGVILDAETKKAIPNTTIINRKIKQHSASDGLGHFFIEASTNDTLVVLNNRYVAGKKVVKAGRQMKADTIFLLPKINQLKTVEILSDYARYKRDSAETRALYRKIFVDVKRKPKTRIVLDTISPMRGTKIQVDGLFTLIARRISGQNKKEVRLIKGIVQGEQAQYASLKYTVEKVKAILNVNDSLASDFIVTHPIPYSFLSNATELEMLAWIKEQSVQTCKK